MEWCKHDLGDFIYEHPACGACPSDEEIEECREWFMGFIQYRRERPKSQVRKDMNFGSTTSKGKKD